MRVQIPAYTDRWMMGDRYGEVTKTYRGKSVDRYGNRIEVVKVKLDKSGVIVCAILDDCEVIE